MLQSMRLVVKSKHQAWKPKQMRQLQQVVAQETDISATSAQSETRCPEKISIEQLATPQPVLQQTSKVEKSTQLSERTEQCRNFPVKRHRRRRGN